MPFLNINLRGLGAWLAAASILAAGPAAAGGILAPLAPVPAEPVWESDYQIQQFRVNEAAAKARGYLKSSQQDPAKTAAMDDYDVSFYGLDLRADHVAEVLTGTTRITARVTAPQLAAVELHLWPNMAVSEVRCAGSAAAFSRLDGVLTATLDRTYLQGETFTLAVDYQGDPASEYWGWTAVQGGTLVWSLSEPYGARRWWACKDLNTDKADSVDLNVTVMDPMIVASNGLLQGTTVPEAGWTTFHWRERYSIAPYLVSVAIHPYSVFQDTYVGLSGQTMPVINYVVPHTLSLAMAGYAPTVSMIGAFAGALGEYPFIDEKYGHAHFAWGGGMEHQTCTSMHTSIYNPLIIAHELAHQWFGDLITCEDFHHIWLNEGFATWSEALWMELSEGAAAYHEEMDTNIFLDGGTVFVEEPTDMGVIFDYGLTYQKASWVVHMLRGVLGDEDFFASLAAYRQAYAFSSATTEDFQAVCEAVSGRDLGAFFSQWIYGEYYPEYELSWTTTPEGAGHRVDVRIAQIQTQTGLFKMPLTLRITTAGGPTDHRVENGQWVQWFSFATEEAPLDLEIDPDGWVLCLKSAAGISGLPLPGRAPVLLGAAPNPFNPVTEIRFHLPEPATVQLGIYDLAGRLVRDLGPGSLAAGTHGVRWDGIDGRGDAVASGTYFARMVTPGGAQVRPLALVR